MVDKCGIDSLDLAHHETHLDFCAAVKTKLGGEDKLVPITPINKTQYHFIVDL